MRQMEVNLKTSFKFSSDWQIIAETKISTKPLSECKITIFEIDITEKLKNALEPKLQAAVNRADEKIENLAQMNPKAQSAWDNLNEPILFDKKHEAWLEFRPLRVSVSPISGNGNKASIIFDIRSEPKVILNPKRPSQKREIAFPNLSIESKSEKGFHLEVRGKLKHDEATKILSNLLVNKQFTFAGGRKIKIKEVKVYGSGVRTVIQVDVRGSFDGRIYFTGSPDYDPEKDELFVKNLDSDLKTKDFLFKTANWLLHGKLREKIMDVARCDLSSYIVGSKNQLNEIINRRLTGNIRLSGKVYNVKPLAVASIRHSFQVLVQIDGEAEISITEGENI
jgi:hypothetical protein